MMKLPRGDDRIDSQRIQWHPGFYGAAELELIADRDALEFHREFSLSKEPLRVDLLIIKKRRDVVVSNEIGRIFRTYNVIEYKSPDDTLTVDDFFKTLGYACLYKGLGETVNRIPADQLTVSVFHERYPQKLADELTRLGLTVREAFPGVYYVDGMGPLRVQIVATGRLEVGRHSLRLLSKNASREDVKAFLEEAETFTLPGEHNNANAVLRVSVAANHNLYTKIRRDFIMYDALHELMKDDLDQAKREALSYSITKIMTSLKLSAEQAMDVLEIPVAERGFYQKRL